MKVTIITKQDGPSCDVFVAALSTPLAEISQETRNKIRARFDCDGLGETDEDDDDASVLFFREVEVVDLKSLNTLLNADGE